MSRESAVVIANAIIWGVVLVSSALALRGTGAFSEIQHILGGGAAFSIILVGFGIRRRPRA